MSQRTLGNLCVMGFFTLVFVSRTIAIVFGESGNSTLGSFVLMFICGVAAGWKMDQLTRGKWQPFRAVRKLRTPFVIEMTLIALGAVWYFADVTMLMRSPTIEVTVQNVTVWLLLTVGIGASLSRAIADRRQVVAIERLKTGE